MPRSDVLQVFFLYLLLLLMLMYGEFVVDNSFFSFFDFIERLKTKTLQISILVHHKLQSEDLMAEINECGYDIFCID